MLLTEKALVQLRPRKTKPKFGIRMSEVTIPIEFVERTGRRVICEIDTTPPDTLITNISLGVDIVRQSEPKSIQLVETTYTIRMPPKTPLLGS